MSLWDSLKAFKNHLRYDQKNGGNKPVKIQKKEVWKAQLQSCGTAVAAGGMSEKKSMLISLLPIQLPRSLNGFN